MLLEYTFEKMSGGAYQVRLQGEFVCYIMDKDPAQADEILKNAGFTSRQDFLNFCEEGFIKNTVSHKEEQKMNIEQKMAYVRKALEMGADLQLAFHGINSKEEAEKIADTLGSMTNRPFEELENEGVHWFKIYNWENKMDTVVFYETDSKESESFLEEDVVLDGGVEYAS